MRHWLRGVLGVWLWMVVGPAWAEDARELLQQMDNRMHSGAYEMYSVVAFELPNGRVNKVTIYSAKKRGRQAVAVVVAPDDLKGRAVLRVGDEVWMHVPGELALRKSNLMVSMIGGVFNNADLLLGDFLEEYQPKWLVEEEKNWLVELTPRFPSSPYARMVLRVDKKSLMPMDLEQFDAYGMLLKTIRYRDVQSVDGAHLSPKVMETASELNRKYQSTWSLGSMNSREFPPSAFTPEFLPTAGRLMK